MKINSNVNSFGRTDRDGNPVRCAEKRSVKRSRCGMWSIAFLALLICGISRTAWAQTSSGSISGRVVDQGGGIVVNAVVRLIDQQTNSTMTTKVLSSGNFIFPVVQPGTFSVIVTAPGFSELKKDNLRLSASERLSAGTLTLQVGEVTQTVTVSADITPIQSTSAERSGLLDDKQMENLMAIGRDFMAFVRVMPGVVGSEGGESLGTSGIPTINGVSSEYSTATVDGVTGNTRGLATLDTPPNLDAIKEVKVLSANYQAEYGKQAGAIINIVTKNGTQQFHGAAYYYFRNEDLNANDWFTKYNGVLSRARYRYNTIGGDIGGPVYWPGHFNKNKNKLFFFVSAEYLPVKAPEGLKKYTVPTALERTGDFSQTYTQGPTTTLPANLITIRDPQSSGGCPTTAGTAGDHSGCFAGNVIPKGRISADEQALLNIMPLPDPTITRAISAGNYNYLTNYSADKPVNQEIFRIDYYPTERLHMFGRGELETVNNNGHSSPANKLPWLMPVNYRTTNPNFAFNVIYTFSPTMVNELTVGTAGWSEVQLYQKSDLEKVLLNPNGYNIGSLHPGNNPKNLVPNVSYGGVTNAATYGWDSRFPMQDQVRSYSLTDSVTKILGRHNLKFGIDAQTDAYLQVQNNGVGSFSFGRDANNPLDSNYAYSNALLGNFDNYTEITKLLNYNPRTNALEWYTQDQWKVNQRLTLDYGIRYSWAMAQRLEHGANFVPSMYDPAKAPVLYVPLIILSPTPTNPKATKTVAVDPGTGIQYPGAYVGLNVPNTGDLANGTLSVNTPGFPQGSVYGNGILFAPRVGFAFDPHGDGKSVIRGGFGIFYNVRARSGQEGDLFSNPPTTFKPEQFYGNIANFQDAGGLLGPSSVGHAINLHAKEVSTMNMSLGIQQMVGAGIVADIAYVGTLGRHVTAYYPINEVAPLAHFQPQNQGPADPVSHKTTPLPDNFYRPYPGYGNINYQDFNLTSNYNSLQAQLTRRFSHGLEFGAAYTWSRSMDYTDTYNGTVAQYADLRSYNYGPAGWDHRNNFVANYLWSIPKASSLWNNFAIRSVLDNWQISGIVSYLSGGPDGISYSTVDTSDIGGGGDGVRAYLSGDVLQGAPHTFKQWFNTSVVQRPSQATATQMSNGNAPKVSVYDPGVFNMDTALFKNMPIENKFVVQFRLETYNTLNHAEFNSVDTGAKFDTVSKGSPQTSATFGQINGAGSPRRLQLALRINF